MNFDLISLGDLIRNSEIGENEINNILSDFSCPFNIDIEDFLKNKAITFEKVNLSRTTLVYKIDQFGKKRFCAYFSLSSTRVPLTDLSRAERRKILGTSYTVGDEVSAILIGQLSKNYRYNNDQLITGDELLSIVFSQIAKSDIILPSLLVYVDCEDVEQLKRFYEAHGFMYFKTMKHNNGKELLCYVAQTRKIVEAINRKAKDSYY